MALKEQLRSDLTAAMKARDELRAATLRMALTAVTTEEVAGKKARVLSDDEVVTGSNGYHFNAFLKLLLLIFY